MAMSTVINRDIIGAPPPMPKILFPLANRISWGFKLYIYKIVIAISFFYRSYFRRTLLNSQPTFVKRYPCRPMLEHRVFFPRDYQPGGPLLPLYLNIHGGGFVFGEPSQDDEFNHSWATRTGMLVVSLDYRKAPLHPFPIAIHDISAITSAILEDETLPVDRSRVAIGGFSAGGSLAISSSQLPNLKGTIKAVVAYYPVVDFSTSPTEKLESRPYTTERRDRFGEASWWLDWAYIRVGENRRDPLLSPYFAKKEDLPPSIYIIGAQWDMFRLEAQEMIHKLAGLVNKNDREESFQKDTYKWTLAMGCSHGFTHRQAKDPANQLKNKRQCEGIYREAHEWLQETVLSE